MARKRKAARPRTTTTEPVSHKYVEDETFDDSEDEFLAGRDRVMLDERPEAKRRRKTAETEKDLAPSDEEVYSDIHESDDEDGNEDNLEKDDQSEGSDGLDGNIEDGEDKYWGPSREDYYNADTIETEADAQEEEEEARRLQQKQIKSMTEADFGFDEDQWVNQNDVNASSVSNIERLPTFQIPADATSEELSSILQSRYPEFSPLMADFMQLHPIYEELKLTSDTKTEGSNSKKLSTQEIKYRALGAYLAAILMYLSIIASPNKGTTITPAEVREHPIMKSILRCRQVWDAVQDLADYVPELQITHRKLEAQVPSITATQDVLKVKKPKKQKQKTQEPTKSPVEDDNDLAVSKSKSIKKAKRSRHSDLQDLLHKVSNSKVDVDSDFGDEQPLTVEEAEEKARKKRSLRFYTSQISQKASKRGAASRGAGGDDDIPRKERLRDRQDRLMREAEQSRNTADHEISHGDNMSVEDEALGQEMNEDANEYYDMLVSNSKEKKETKQIRAAAYAEAASMGAQVFEQEQVGPDGKRRITYAIEKNKGLAPKRKKDVRNPRVKKRKKYDEKLKKLASVRQVYKGGEGRGGYKGELTGIKANVVKSVKL